MVAAAAIAGRSRDRSANYGYFSGAKRRIDRWLGGYILCLAILPNRADNGGDDYHHPGHPDYGGVGNLHFGVPELFAPADNPKKVLPPPLMLSIKPAIVLSTLNLRG